jgi:hypothetical protein
METIKESGYRYAKRDAAFKEWLKGQPFVGSTLGCRITMEAFHAGWLARKVSEYKATSKG